MIDITIISVAAKESIITPAPGGVRRSGEVQQGLCDDDEDDAAGQKLMA